MTRDTDIIVGFDLGHGETAVAWAGIDTNDPPKIVDLPGANRRQHITAVAVHPERGVLVGRQAVTTRGVSELYLGFKSPELGREEVRRPTEMFVKKVQEDLRAHGEISSRRTHWVFGSPSGWTRRMRQAYATLLRRTGITDLDVVAESRAALLYARDSGELKGSARVDMKQLSGRVLIIDLGSSTTDFTAVIDRKSRPFDFGSQLGASLIDKTIQARVVAQHEERDRLDALLDDPVEARQVELRCRMAKENFFDQFQTDPETIEILPYVAYDAAGRIIVEIQLTATEMDAVLDTPQHALGGTSWREAFRSDLASAAAALGGPLDVVLLTGGASRMQFVKKFAQEQFGRDVVRLGSEPETAIARGLTLAGRLSARAAGFRRDIAVLTGSAEGSDQIKALVVDRLPELAQALGATAADGITERHVVPAFVRWRNSKITTLRQVADEIAGAVRAELTDPGNRAVAKVVVEWQNSLLPDIDELTRPICLRWHVPPAAMRPAPVHVTDREWRISVDHSDAAIGALDALTATIIGMIGTMALAAAGAAVTATGPFAAILIGIAAIAGVLVGRDAAREKLLDANLPAWARELRGESALLKRVRRDATVREAELASGLAMQLQMGGGDALTREITVLIARELERLADDAELLIAT